MKNLNSPRSLFDRAWMERLDRNIRGDDALRDYHNAGDPQVSEKTVRDLEEEYQKKVASHIQDSWRSKLHDRIHVNPKAEVNKAPKPMKPRDIQFGGSHYKNQEIQPWDLVSANNLDYWQGTIIKYIMRWKLKGGIQDLEKARHTLDQYLEVLRSQDDTYADAS